MTLNSVPLHTLCSRVATWNPRSADPDDTFNYIDIASIDRDKKQIIAAVQYIGRDAPSRARQIVQAGDVLVSTVRPNLNAVAIVPPILAGATASTGFTVLRADPKKLDARYLFQWVKNPLFVMEMTSSATGASYPAVSDGIVKNSCIPLPALAEQKRIAAILDEADALHRKRAEAIAKLDALLQSVFLETFGDPVTNSKGWGICPFEQVAKSQLGKMLDEKKQAHLPQRKYLRNANVRWGEFDLSDIFEMGIADDERERFKILPGDILVCEGGEPGRSAIWNGEIEDCYYQKALHRIRVNPTLCTSEYVLFLLWRLAMSGGLSDSISLVTIAHLTGEKLKQLLIPIPPFQLQKEFTSKVTAINSMRERSQASLNRQEALLTVLQHQAFRSEATDKIATQPPTSPCPTLDF